MNKNIYRRLASHLNRLPGGFPSSENDADLHLLEHLFTTQEAELAIHLTLEHETAQVIAEKTGLSMEVIESRLNQMAEKGLILSKRTQDGSYLYQAAPLVVGIYELQIKNLTPELLNDFHTYWSSIKERQRAETIPQMRTIPVGESIVTQLEAMPYEQVNELVKTNERFAVTTCICRRAAKMTGEGCLAPEESCLIFGDWADFYIRTGRGRSISRAEMFDLLATADKANLVLQPSNSRDIQFICCCCGCCCGILGGIKSHPRPADAVASAFIAQLALDICEGCWTCVDRCQMDALTAGEVHVEFKPERCIGCGLCVTTCPSGALTLRRKPETLLTRVPPTLVETWQIIARDQAQAQ